MLFRSPIRLVADVGFVHYLTADARVAWVWFGFMCSEISTRIDLIYQSYSSIRHVHIIYLYSQFCLIEYWIDQWIYFVLDEWNFFNYNFMKVINIKTAYHVIYPLNDNTHFDDLCPLLICISHYFDLLNRKMDVWYNHYDLNMHYMIVISIMINN